MYFALMLHFFDAILFNLVIMYIPQKKYYTINHFKNFLLNYEGNSEDISNYNNYINELDVKLENCLRINQAILAFSIILLIISIAIIFIIIIYISNSRESQVIDVSIFYASNGTNTIRLILSIIDWSMAIAIIAKINKIRKEEDKIGLTNEIKSGIIKVIIILSFYFIYCIYELIFIIRCFGNVDSLFLYNKHYIERKLNNQKKELEENNINKERNPSTLSSTKKEESEQLRIEGNKEKKLLELLKNKEKDIKELKDQVNQKNEKIKKLEQINNNQKKEIKELESENPYKLKKNEKLITIIFAPSNQKFHYSLICKNTQKFAFVEQELYDIFPDYKDTENYFLVNGIKINRNKTIEENNIKFSDIIIINKIDDKDE